jgi:hypothetical protein
MSLAASLKSLYTSLSDEQKAALSESENTKYAAIVAEYDDYMKQAVTCTFIDAKPSASAFTLTGSKSSKTKDKFTVNAYGGELATGLKLESGTQITVTITTKMVLTLYLDAAKKVNVDGTAIAATTNADGDNVVVVTLEAGTHTIEKKESVNLYYATLTPVA